jgi:two-component system, OmpR family, response regulator VicR
MVNGGHRPSGILVVDDDRDLVELLAFLIEQAGFAPLTATEPITALELFDKELPTMAIVDLNLQPWDGFELVAELRRRNEAVTIIVLTGRNSEDDKVRALEIGADDYVVKPFGHRELVARIKAHNRRAELDREVVQTPAVLEVGPLLLDSAERTVRIDGELLRLTGNEFRLLNYLMRNKESVISTAALAKRVSGYDDAPAREVVRVTVHRLRRKLRDDGPQRRFIHTVPGVGFKLQPVTREQESEHSL